MDVEEAAEQDTGVERRGQESITAQVIPRDVYRTSGRKQVFTCTSGT